MIFKRILINNFGGLREKDIELIALAIADQNRILIGNPGAGGQGLRIVAEAKDGVLGQCLTGFGPAVVIKAARAATRQISQRAVIIADRDIVDAGIRKTDVIAIGKGDVFVRPRCPGFVIDLGFEGRGNDLVFHFPPCAILDCFYLYTFQCMRESILRL